MAMQIVGRHFDDRLVLRVARAYETVAPLRHCGTSVSLGSIRTDVSPGWSGSSRIATPSSQDVMTCASSRGG